MSERLEQADGLMPRYPRCSASMTSQLLAPHGWRLRGFELEPCWTERYRAAFPGDPDRRSLANRHTFELRHPEVFAGMYQFSVQ